MFNTLVQAFKYVINFDLVESNSSVDSINLSKGKLLTNLINCFSVKPKISTLLVALGRSVAVATGREVIMTIASGR